MAIRCINDDPQRFIDWLMERLRMTKITGQAEAQAYGFVDNDRIVGSFVFSEYTGHDVHMYCASDNPRIFQRRYIKAMFDYCFNDLKVRRVSAMCNESNLRSRKLISGVGFKQEGRLRRYFGFEDALVYGLLREEMRFL